MRPALHTALAAAGTTVLALMIAPSSATAAPPDLVDTVTSRLLTMEVSGSPAAEARGPIVTVSRESGGWAFGTAVLAGKPDTEDYPYGWLFVAKRSGNGWQLGFEGQPAFAELSAAAPMVSPQERELLASHGGQAGVDYANGDYRTGMRMPWATGVSWIMSGGPHGWGGTDRPYSSLDLHGGDQVVRATRAGTAYTMCRGWIRVIHDRGYATDYYHLWNNINVNGAAVSAGARLGDTGTDVTCGGSASGRHVHFGLRQNSAFVPVHDHSIGGWVPVAGAAYGGYALHGSTIRYPGGALYNYGALGFNQGIVDTNGGTTLNKRSGPGTGYAVVGSVADGVTVTVSCSRNGTTHTGRYGSTSLWNRLTDGTWVSDAFMWTGLNGPLSGYC
jgi:LasA protease